MIFYNSFLRPVLCDFNSHSTLWGCTKLDRRGKMVEDIITKHHLCILNDSSSTYIHPATGSSSAIDLSICSPDIFLDMQWMICVAVIIIPFQYLMAPKKLHPLFLAGNFVKLTGPLSPTRPANCYVVVTQTSHLMRLVKS